MFIRYGGLDLDHEVFEVAHQTGNGGVLGQRAEDLAVFVSDGADEDRCRVAVEAALGSVNGSHHTFQCPVGHGKIQVVEGTFRAFLCCLCRSDADNFHKAEFMKE